MTNQELIEALIEEVQTLTNEYRELKQIEQEHHALNGKLQEENHTLKKMIQELNQYPKNEIKKIGEMLEQIIHLKEKNQFIINFIKEQHLEEDFQMYKIHKFTKNKELE